MTLTIDNERLRALIPGVIHEVQGETSLYDKMLPWLTSEQRWLENIFFGDYEPSGDILNLAEVVIVNRAFARAIPSLDVTLSPAGFAVINTEGRAPASKERIERLIKSLDDFADENLVQLSKSLLGSADWCESPAAQWWLSTFCPSLEDVAKYVSNSGQSMMDVYKACRNILFMFESDLAENFIGTDLMERTRMAVCPGQPAKYSALWSRIHDAACRVIYTYMVDKRIYKSRDVWKEAAPLIRFIKSVPDLALEWEAEKGDFVKVEPFVNDHPGGYFF